MGNQYQFKHGQYRSPEYKAWTAMKQRCQNPKCKGWPDYGGRGIKVCERWNDSTAFLEDMGPRPSPKHSVERRDNNGHYEPTNCYWTIRSDQNRNKRNNVMLTFRGETRCMMDWAKLYSVPFVTLRHRLKYYGWTIEEALTTPSQKGKRPDRLREEAGTLISFNGKSMSIPEWADYLGLNRVSLGIRLKRWPLEKALTQKPRKWTHK